MRRADRRHTDSRSRLVRLAAAGAFLQERDQVVHEGQLLFAAGAPAQAEGGHQVGELFAVEDHSAEDEVDEALQGVSRQAVPPGDGGEFLGVLLGLEALVASADGLFVQRLARFE